MIDEKEGLPELIRHPRRDRADDIEPNRRPKHKADPVYARLAEARIDDLKKEEDKKVEAERLAAVQRQQEEEKRKQAEAEAPAKAEAVRLALLQKEQEERKRAEELRCNGIVIAVSRNDRRCFNPGAGKIERIQDCPTCPEVVVVPTGAFTMGSPANEPHRYNDEAQVPVTISAPLAVGRFAVTFDEWDACVVDRGCDLYNPRDEWGRGKQPVINVSWHDAKAYAAGLSRKTGKTYRLLSEAEREYVTRACTTTPFRWGSSITLAQANYDASADYKVDDSKWGFVPGPTHAMPVNSFEPNPWGLYNVDGNVWEWTEDCWNESNTGNPGDGSARTFGDCSRRVRWVLVPQSKCHSLRRPRRVGSRQTAQRAGLPIGENVKSLIFASGFRRQ
jgi:formylglycine-generating enzyme required for sulfatase activity